MYTVYILFSPGHNKIYIGCTSNMEARFLSHNVLGNKGWTIKFRPWEILYRQEFENKNDAFKKGKELKTAKGREWIWDVLVANR